MTTTFKFALPVGAIVGHMRHLGNGEFITDLKSAGSEAPVVFELLLPEGAQIPPQFVEFSMCEDPLTGATARRAIQLAKFTSDGEEILPGHKHWDLIKVERAHDSDCSVHNEPAMPAGPCDCSLLPEASPATKGQCNDERACSACFSGQGQYETAKPAPSVTPDDVEAAISHTFYANVGDAENANWPDPNARDEFHPALSMITICTLVTKNGHSVVGVAYCADPAKFDAQTGRDAARADAICQLRPMVIYAERECLAVPPSIQLTPAEVQSGSDRVRWAEGLIKQLPEDHEGRNSWLMNYGSKTEST